ncbi:MAG: beta-propeller fold lactonase family protein [Saprospiraceae bacterium]|nr:beta-propeller fold lactonase family protein [Lewinella sp.]
MKIELKTLVVVLSSLFVLSSCSKQDFTENPALDEASITDDLPAARGKHHGFYADPNRSGAVYTMDNAMGSNHVIAFNRSKDGTLGKPKMYATQGGGTGSGLGSQGSIVSDGEYLYVCNAGSNSISVFKIAGPTLHFVDKAYSQGTMPISLTVYDNIVYVLNAGGSGNISGFRSYYGHLSFIYGSSQSLSTSSAAGGQISFNNDGDQLVVTEKATNRITTYAVGADGRAGLGTPYPSAGETPFGFGFSADGDILVSEAFGGAPGGSTVTAYSLGTDGSVNTTSGPIATGQTAACWLTVTDDGDFAYVTNTGSNNVTSFRISNTGQLQLQNGGNTAAAGAGPIDLDTSEGSIFVYVLNGGDDSISIFSRRYNGALHPVGTVTGLPASVVGIAAD